MRRFQQGASVLELVVCMGVFSVLGAILFLVLLQGLQGLRTMNSQRDTELRLNNSHFWLRRDLEQTSPEAVNHKRISHLPGNGDALWFLTAEDPLEANPELRYRYNLETFEPEWQRTVLYYLIRPSNYQAVSGGLIPGVDPDPRQDYFAPHKFLIRKVIDRPGDPEELMTPGEVDVYLTAPADHRLAGLSGESGVVDVRLIADGMLSFEVERDGAMLEIATRALRIEEANRRIGDLGNRSLRDEPLTVMRLARYWLQNRVF